MPRDERSKKEKALDKLGELIFGETGKEPVGEEVEREINKGRGSSDEGEEKK